MPARCLPLVVVAILVTAQPGLSRAGDCDALLVTDDSNPLSYRQREGRCEGIFVEQVAGSVMLPVALTSAVDLRTSPNAEALSLAWPSPDLDASLVRIRGKATAWRVHYRMDAVRPLVDHRWRWPTDVLDAAGISRDELAVMGWTSAQLGGVQRDIYLPLRVSSGDEQVAAGDAYRLVVMPSVPLQEAYLSVATVGDDGRPGEFVIDGQPLRYGYYPAHRPLEIPLSGLTVPGIYHVELSARLRSGGSSILTLLFQHAATAVQ
mgnify:CR=1 FL=1